MAKLPDNGFSVLVFDMARTGEPDGERLVPGFASLETARAYAEARVRASVEALRQPGMAAEDLRRLWLVYGEDCSVVGGGFRAGEALDVYIAIPATASECDWPALAPWLHRFYCAVLMLNKERQSVWAGGFLRRFLKPDSKALLELYREDAAAAFAGKDIADTEAVDVHVASLFELPDPPYPPNDGRPLRNWRVEVDFVCHDIKFGGMASGVFAWPQEPDGWALRAMTNLLTADQLAVRGDGPDYAQYCDILATRVGETGEACGYPLDIGQSQTSS